MQEINRSNSMINLCDCNWTPTQNHLVRKETLNHLAENSEEYICSGNICSCVTACPTLLFAKLRYATGNEFAVFQ